MPKRMHRALARSASKKGMTGSKRDRYVYGAMENRKKKASSKSKRKKG